MRLNFITLTAAAALCIPAAVLAEAPKSSSAPSAKPAATPQSTAPGQTGTTPGQSQATPGQASDLTPAVTGETPSGQTTAKGQATADTKPAKAEVKAGASVYDAKGQLVGKIDSVDGKSAVLNTGKVQVKVPLSSIARDEKGLAIGMSKAEIEAAASKK